jgi:hypothetical protein
MGMLIHIKKKSEYNNGREFLYSFSTPEGDFGEVSIDKSTGECFVVQEPEWDKESKLAIRVGIKLLQHWRKGEFPDITMWAS